jgi:hypothetical protein
MLRFVVLADGATLDEVADEAQRVGVLERRPEPLQSLLDALMACAMCRGEELGP